MSDSRSALTAEAREKDIAYIEGALGRAQAITFTGTAPFREIKEARRRLAGLAAALESAQEEIAARKLVDGYEDGYTDGIADGMKAGAADLAAAERALREAEAEARKVLAWERDATTKRLWIALPLARHVLAARAALVDTAEEGEA